MNIAAHRPRKRFGQHFLIRPEIAQRIVEIAALRGDESVLEIGPGHGALTEVLRQRCARLILIEIDRDLAAALRERYASDGNVRIIEGDVLEVDLETELAGENRLTVVANLPYNISTPILSRFVEGANLYRRLVLMVQAEVAERLCAAPGGRDYGALSVALQLVASARIALRVPRSAFRPQPKVDSAVVVVEPHAETELAVEERPAVRRVTRALFNQRRKQLGNLLRQLTPRAAAVLARLDIDPRRRPETLTPQDFVRLTRAIGDDPGDVSKVGGEPSDARTP